MREMLSTRDVIKDSLARVFTGDWSCRYPLPNTYHTSRFPEGKHVVSINHIVYINSLGTMSHSYLGNGENPPKIQVPDASQGPTLQTGVMRTVSGLLW